MEMIKVKSSNISEIGYEKDKLRIKFKSGGEYEYEAVPDEIFQNFMKADSKGKYFHAGIFSKYKFRKIEPEKPIIKQETKDDKTKRSDGNNDQN